MLEERLEVLRERIRGSAEAAGRDPTDITLVAVSKGQPLDALREAYALGIRDFGESRVQELAEKAAAMPDDVRWHFVGALQSNKLAKVRGLAHLVHSFDRPELAEAWTRGADEAAPAPPVLLQVNIGDEPQKRGVERGQTVASVARMVDAGVRVEGLMCLPPRGPAEAVAGHLRALRELRDACQAQGLDVPELSMGMSGDLEIAVAEGATLVRVGTALFGSHEVRPLNHEP